MKLRVIVGRAVGRRKFNEQALLGNGVCLFPLLYSDLILVPSDDVAEEITGGRGYRVHLQSVKEAASRIVI